MEAIDNKGFLYESQQKNLERNGRGDIPFTHNYLQFLLSTPVLGYAFVRKSH